MLATIAVMRNVSSAIQFCGSEMVKVLTGGRKKKLNSAVAAKAVNSARRSPQKAEVNRTSTRKLSATVVGFTRNHWP